MRNVQSWPLGRVVIFPNGDVGALYAGEYIIVVGTGRVDAMTKLATLTRAELAASVVTLRQFMDRVNSEQCGFGGQIAVRAEVTAGG